MIQLIKLYTVFLACLSFLLDEDVDDKDYHGDYLISVVSICSSSFYRIMMKMMVDNSYNDYLDLTGAVMFLSSSPRGA